MPANPTSRSKTKGAILSLTLALAVASASVPVASGVTGWRIVKQGSTSGQFAVTAISGTVSKPNPRGIAIRLKGNVTSGMGVVACVKGFSVASWSRSYSRAGLYVLPMTARADSCDITASVGGAGRVVVQILKR
jgi:hypothetical protein